MGSVPLHSRSVLTSRTTQSPEVLPNLEELYQRGRNIGVELEMVTEEQARRIEPVARTHEAAIWSPNTAAAGVYLRVALVWFCFSHVDAPLH